MTKFIKKTFKKPGMTPGALVHVDHPSKKQAALSVLDYTWKDFREKNDVKVEDCFQYCDTDTVTWINLDGVHDVNTLKTLNDHFGIHPLATEDIANTGHRPKLEEFEDQVLLILKMLYSDPSRPDEIISEQISIVLGKNYVISYQEQVGDVLNPVRERIRDGKGRIRSMGSDYLAYAIMDAIVDHYFVVLEHLGEQVESLEDAMMNDVEPEMVHLIHRLKREMIYLRKQTWPLREVTNSLLRDESKLITKKIDIFIRDVYDHIIQISDTIDSYRDVLSGMHDIYLSVMSNKMNEIMKVLTIFAAIFIPLTFIAGIYGMNFEYMPELKWRYSYFVTITAMISIGVSMVMYFKKRKWF